MIRQIVVHPGGAHKDDFLACALLVAEYRAPIFRRDPTAQDLADEETAVVDVGMDWNAEKNNFDHHQFPRDVEPLCALSLVLKSMNLYDEARKFCEWLELAEVIDTRGPNDTAQWLGIERETMSKLNSPIDITLLRRFASMDEHRDGEPLYEVMSMIGEDTLDYVKGMKERLEFLAEHCEVWELAGGKKAVFLPRTDPLPEEPSMGLGRYVEDLGLEDDVVALVYPDRRGSGYGLGRFKDDKRMEYTLVGGEEDVHFAHNKGFIAKTSATEISRLRELIGKAFVAELKT